MLGSLAITSLFMACKAAQFESPFHFPCILFLFSIFFSRTMCKEQNLWALCHKRKKPLLKNIFTYIQNYTPGNKQITNS